MGVYALIKNGVVENAIVADAAFISNIESNYDQSIDVTSMEPRPSVGWTYDSGTETFTDPSVPIEE
jgi:hypothetical protein